MDYARDPSNGRLVTADVASSERSYKCPRPGCGGRVRVRDGGHRRAHFAHYPGEGTTACDEYFPSIGNDSEQRASARVEDEASELGVLLAHVDGHWGLGLRLPEIPSEELGDTSLAALRSACVDVYAGRDSLLRVSALELRPGVRAARVDVALSLQGFRTEPAGSWPSTIDRGRWRLESRGIEAKGVLFRHRRGEWTRLAAGSGVHLGESLLVLAEVRCPPPMESETHGKLWSAGLQWCICEVRLPTEPQEQVTAWLARLGHQVVPRPWSVNLATPPREYGEGGEPVFWVDDVPVLVMEAPRRTATAMVSFQSGTNSHSHSIDMAESERSTTQIRVKGGDAGRSRLTVAGERTSSLDIAFTQQPSRAVLLEQLAGVPRLRIQIGSQTLEAWQGLEHRVRVPLREQLDVHVDLGGDTVRARVTVWEHGKQRTRRGLDTRGVKRVIDDALATASRLEVDVDNLGRVAILPERAALETLPGRKRNDRIGWRDAVASLASDNEPNTLFALVDRPGSSALAIRRVSAAALVRARLTLRRRTRTGGTPA